MRHSFEHLVKTPSAITPIQITRLPYGDHPLDHGLPSAIIIGTQEELHDIVSHLKFNEISYDYWDLISDFYALLSSAEVDTLNSGISVATLFRNRAHRQLRNDRARFSLTEINLVTTQIAYQCKWLVKKFDTIGVLPYLKFYGIDMGEPKAVIILKKKSQIG